MSTVVAAIDDTPAGASVLAAATTVARLFAAGVEALHVSEDGDRVPRALTGAFAVPLRLAHDSSAGVAAAVVEAAGRPGVVAVAVGVSARGRRPTAVGHVAHEVITRVSVPVIAVPAGASVPSSIGRVLVPLDGTVATAQALRTMLEAASGNDVDVTVLHVYDATTIPMFSDQPVHEARAWVEEFLRRHCPRPEAVSLEVRVGTPATRVLDVGVETRADLLVLGWSRDLSPGRARVVRSAITTSAVPVMLVPVAAGDEAASAPGGTAETAAVAGGAPLSRRDP